MLLILKKSSKNLFPFWSAKPKGICGDGCHINVKVPAYWRYFQNNKSDVCLFIFIRTKTKLHSSVSGMDLQQDRPPSDAIHQQMGATIERNEK